MRKAAEDMRERNLEAILSNAIASQAGAAVKYTGKTIGDRKSTCLAAQCEIPPPIAQYPFEIVSQRGVSHPFALVS